MAEIIKNTS